MSGYGPPRGWRGSNTWAAEASQRPTEDAEVGDHMERLRDMLTPTTKALILGDGDVRALRAALDELERLRAERKELEAVLAEGAQRDRALALLLLRSGGQVEFTLAERVAAPRDGELISYPNAATGGLVLAFQAATPQQTAPCVCDCKAGQPCHCGLEDCECVGGCPVCDHDEDAQQPAPEPQPPTRRNMLLAAIQREGGDWSPLRARAALMSAGYDVASPLAAQEMKTLAASGFLEPVRPRAFTYRLKTEAPRQDETGGAK